MSYQELQQFLDQMKVPAFTKSDAVMTPEERIQWLYTEGLRLKSENALLKAAIRDLVKQTNFL